MTLFLGDYIGIERDIYEVSYCHDRLEKKQNYRQCYDSMTGGLKALWDKAVSVIKVSFLTHDSYDTSRGNFKNSEEEFHQNLVFPSHFLKCLQYLCKTFSNLFVPHSAKKWK